MIPIDRNRTIGGRRIHPGARWSTSAAKATRKAKSERGNHDAKRSVYAHDKVRAALEALTSMKCAYCEVPLARFDWDVEHYRPKGRVRERADHPGYYWLTYNWKNLLPSCTFCNQNRKERPTFEDPTPGDTGGKFDQFPVEDEKKRAMDHTHNVKREVPLLLDPCSEDPAEHIAYDPTGRIFPLPGSKKGETSIRVFRLNLRRLALERRRTLEAVHQFMELRARAKERGEDATANEVADILDSLAADDMPFAGMVRFFIANPEALGVG
ncbi:MAG: TIGR02646 family protein [Gammaproteobacteria bacterium]|nr:TIGR02646 family protein [Gammaproteobacteria bacterium]